MSTWPGAEDNEREMILVALFSIIATALAAGGSITGPLTDDFQTWLEQNGYATDDFVRNDYGAHGSYGGKSDSAPNVNHSCFT